MTMTTLLLTLSLLTTAPAAEGPPSAPAKEAVPAEAAPPSAAKAPVATAVTWPSWRGDATQQGRSPSPLRLPLKETWRAQVADAVVGALVVDETRVYLGSKAGEIVALNRDDGKVLWSVKAEGPVEAPPLVVGDLVVVGSRDRTVRALARDSGALRWAFDAGAEVTGAAVYVPPRGTSGATLLIGGYDGRLHRLDLATGEPVWTYETGSYLYGSAAVRGDTAIIGGCDGYIHVVALDDGTATRRIEIEAYVGASPAWPADAQAYVGHFGNQVLAFDPSSGARLWTHQDRSFPYLSSPAVTDEIVVLGGRDRVVWALDRKTGEPWWMWPTKGKVDASPVLVGGHAVIGSTDGRLYVLGLEDGEAVDTVDLGEPIVATAAVAGGVVYVATEKGTVVALGPKKGRKRGK